MTKHRVKRHRLDRVVVVGNGIAGLTAADTLRAGGFDGQLTIVGDERHAPYSRPALSKAALLDATEMTSHRLPSPTHEGEELLGVAASRLDASRRVVVVTGGEEIPYDGLVIATGSRARRMGGDDSAELALRGLDDALALRRRLHGTPNTVVIGGGPLGMEIASGCLAMGCEVTLAAPEPPLIHHLGAHLSGVMTTAALDQGLAIAGSAAVAIRERGGHATVLLADGRAIETELVITAVGDLPNVEWLDTSSLLRAGALRVDTRGRVRPDIVAAGDVATLSTERGLRRLPFWTSAIEQAKVAALALLHGDDAPELAFQPYFWTEQFGLSLKASGALPVAGAPDFTEGAPHGPGALMRWAHADGSGTAVAINYRIPIPRLRRLAAEGRVASTAA